MFKTQVERRVVSLPSFEHFMTLFVWSIRVKTIENCRRCDFYNNMEKVLAELALFFVEEARVLYLTLIGNSYEPISEREF